MPSREPPERSDPEAFLPLTPAVFHVLLALADGPKHGYAVMMEVERRSGSRVRLGPGTLYGITKRLLVEGLVVEDGAARYAELDRGRRRRTYRLTPLGRAVAEAESRRLERLLDLARAQHLLPDSG